MGAEPQPPGSPADHPYLGHLHVIARRMDSLEAAIRARVWEDVEFRHDQVLRAFQKLERAIAPPPVIAEPPGLHGVALHDAAPGDDLDVRLT